MAEPVKSNRRTTTTPPLKNSNPSKIINSEEEKPSFYECCTCKKHYKKLDDNFPASQSNIYAANQKLPICKICLDKLYDHYCIALGNEDDAIRRICMKFDIYFDQSLLNASRKITKDRSRIHTYISRANLTQYKDKTYDTTIDEEKRGNIIESEDDLDNLTDAKGNISKKMLLFWGTGFSPEDYIFLNVQYKDWTGRHECKTKAQESLFQKICLLEMQINKAIQKGDKIEQLMNAYNTLLGSANVKPVQTNDNTLAEQNTLGTLIKKWENEKPIPEPSEDWKDVDRIGKYITIYFLGHLCKMMGIKNSYSRMYEEEMDKYKVNKPEYEDDDEALFDAVFGGGLDDDN